MDVAQDQVPQMSVDDGLPVPVDDIACTKQTSLGMEPPEILAAAGVTSADWQRSGIAVQWTIASTAKDNIKIIVPALLISGAYAAIIFVYVSRPLIPILVYFILLLIPYGIRLRWQELNVVPKRLQLLADKLNERVYAQRGIRIEYRPGARKHFFDHSRKGHFVFSRMPPGEAAAPSADTFEV